MGCAQYCVVLLSSLRAYNVYESHLYDEACHEWLFAVLRSSPLCAHKTHMTRSDIHDMQRMICMTSHVIHDACVLSHVMQMQHKKNVINGLAVRTTPCNTLQQHCNTLQTIELFRTYE